MKPKFFKSPLAWTARQVRLKTFDFIKVLGFEPVKELNFSHMKGGDFAHVIDVGAADGTPDLYARFPNAFLDVFEPNPEYQAHLERTILKNRPGRVHRMGLGSSDGTLDLFLKGRTGSNFVADKGRGSVSVPVRRLDAVLKADMIKRPCLLKIDTEGWELEVLRGAEGIMPEIDCVVAEVSFYVPNCRPNELIAHLNSLGFEFTEMLAFYCGGGQMWAADFVFHRIAKEQHLKTI